MSVFLACNLKLFQPLPLIQFQSCFCILVTCYSCTPLFICVLVRILQRNRIGVTYICKFIIRNWLMWLQTLRSPKTCSQQADGLGEPTFMSSLSSKAWEPEHLWCKFQSESWQAQDPRRDKVSVQVWRLEKTSVLAIPWAAVIPFYSVFLGSIQVLNW